MIPTATASTLALVTPNEVMAVTQARLRRPNLLRLYVVVAGALTLWLATIAPIAASFVGFGLFVLGVRVRRWDRDFRCTQLVYELTNPEIAARLSMADQAGHALASSSMIWHVHHAVGTTDIKRNAGADTLIQRTPTRAKVGTIPGLELNVAPWLLPLGPQQLLWLPDRLLVWDGRALVGVPHEELLAEASTLRFVESERVPSDSRVVDTTWQFVNKKGGPDRRFSENRQLPVVEYGELHLSTRTGLHLFVQTSNPDAAARAAGHLRMLRERAGAAVGRAATPVVTPTPRYHEPAARPEAGPPALASAVMVLMRSLAAADRRIDDEEIALAFHTHQHLGGTYADLVSFAAWFRSLPANDAALAEAMRTLLAASPDFRAWVIARLEDLTRADGKQTTKELARLAELRAGLGVWRPPDHYSP